MITADKGVRVVAGTILLISIGLTVWQDPNYIWLSVFVSINLIQSAFTGFCPVELLLRKLGME
ncbi:MAG: YgaP family membrane protein [Plesiomonas shigelloides]|uniref:YgaP family membrane protein n=1 Tax=Plesiomonas shigelloides TaxID=703 RepID=UPI0038B3DEA1